MNTSYHTTTTTTTTAREVAARRTALATAAYEEASHWLHAESDSCHLAEQLYQRAYDAWVCACARAGAPADTTARDAAMTEWRACGVRLDEATAAFKAAFAAYRAACVAEVALYA